MGVPDEVNDGFQPWSASYPVLVARLRDEVSARRQGEADVLVLEGRLKEEASLHSAERVQWEDERRALRDELAALWRSRATPADGGGVAWAREEEARRTCQVLIRQGEELSRLRREHADLSTRHEDLQDDLISSRGEVGRLQRALSDLESAAEAEAQYCKATGTRANQLQEELRGALRSASAARLREREAADVADRGCRELRSRDERLAAVRTESQRCARRAADAERRLGAYEARAEDSSLLTEEIAKLRLRVEEESRACGAAKLVAARAEAEELRAAAGACEARSEARCQDEQRTEAMRRAAQTDAELGFVRSEAQRLGGQHEFVQQALVNLRSELREEQQECSEACRRSERLAAELQRSHRRVDAMSRAYALGEERRARGGGRAEAARQCDHLRSVGRGSCLRERSRAAVEELRRCPSSRCRSAGGSFAASPSQGGGGPSDRWPSRPRVSCSSASRSASACAATGAASVAAGVAAAVGAVRGLTTDVASVPWGDGHWGDAPDVEHRAACAAALPNGTFSPRSRFSAAPPAPAAPASRAAAAPQAPLVSHSPQQCTSEEWARGSGPRAPPTAAAWDSATSWLADPRPRPAPRSCDAYAPSAAERSLAELLATQPRVWRAPAPPLAS